MDGGRLNPLVSGPDVVRWVCERTGGTYDSHAVGIGLMRETLVAGVVYDMFLGRSVAMHVAIEGPISRAFIRKCFEYPFHQLGVQKVLGCVDSLNEKALRFDRHLGFVDEAVITGAGRQGDLVILSMTAAQCRWLGD